MQQWPRRPLIVTLCALACAGVVARSWGPSRVDVRTADQNGDGRADTWRLYDRQGQLSELSVDTNFDGRPDVHEYYERGALVRRESDRDFNERVDLVQEFDAATREHARSVVDVDFDGTADLLVLFQAGQPVFWKWAQPASPAAAGADAALFAAIPSRRLDGQLAPLDDPFRGDLALRAVRAAAGAGDCGTLSSSGGLPALSGCASAGPQPSSNAADFNLSNLSSASVACYSPRGPPAAHLLG